MAFSKGFSPSLGTHLAQWMMSNDGASIVVAGGKVELCVRECFLFAGVNGYRGGDSSTEKGVTITYSK